MTALVNHLVSSDRTGISRCDLGPAWLDHQLAEQLEHARSLLEAMGDDLVADDEVLMRHAKAIQAVDIVGQMLGHIANVVRAEDRNAAVQDIGMAQLKSRLDRTAA